MPVKRRLRKKIHARFLDDVILDALSSESLAVHLRQLDSGGEIFISCPAPRDFPSSVRKAINRWRLTYRISLAAEEELAGFDSSEPGAVTYKLQAIRFPNLVVYAEEYPENLGA